MNSKDDGTIRTNKPTRPIFGEPRKFDKPTRPVYFLEPVEFKKSGFAKRGQNPRVLSFKFVLVLSLVPRIGFSVVRI